VPARIARRYRVCAPGGGERAEGYQVGRTLMSYLHLHWASRPECATAFVDACVSSR
jgi:cobyrinic acid a,c-diamide synthase